MEPGASKRAAVSRNSLCMCGSGKRFKQCCGEGMFGKKKGKLFRRNRKIERAGWPRRCSCYHPRMAKPCPFAPKANRQLPPTNVSGNAGKVHFAPYLTSG